MRLGVQPLIDGGVSDSVGVSVEDWRMKRLTREVVELRSRLYVVSLDWLVSRMEEALLRL